MARSVVLTSFYGGHLAERIIGALFGIAFGLWAIGYALRYGFKE